MAEQTTNSATKRIPGTTESFAANNQGESTRHDRVDVFRAEHLADDYPDLSAVRIREVFEGEPVKRAIGLILWARKNTPHRPYHQYRKLKDWAWRNERGFYNRAVRKRTPEQDRRQYMAYLEQKRAEKEQTTGRAGLLPSEVIALTEEFHAPSYRAELASITDGAKFVISKEMP